MIEPLVLDLAQVDERGRVDLITAQHRRRAPAERTVVVRSDEQRVIGVRVVPIVLGEIINRGRLAVGEVPGHRQHRNIDAGELIRDRGSSSARTDRSSDDSAIG